MKTLYILGHLYSNIYGSYGKSNFAIDLKQQAWRKRNAASNAINLLQDRYREKDWCSGISGIRKPLTPL